MGCAASVPEEDKKNKKGGKGKEPAAEAEKATELAPTTTTTTTTEAAKPAEEPKPAAEAEKPKEAPKAEEAKPAEPVPVAASSEPAKPAEPEKPKEEPKVEEVKKEEPKVEEAPKAEEPKPVEPVVAEPVAAEPVKTEEVKVEPKEEAPKDEAPKSEEPKVEQSAEAAATRKPKIAVVYYSTYGHIMQLAEQVAEGAKKTGAQVDIFQVRETLPEEVLEKMHAPPKGNYPFIEVAQTLTEYDAFLFGVPTRFGIWPAQWKTFLDSTGQLWQTGAIHGKFGGIFTSTASQHGGIETTAFNALTFFTHHGINFVPFGYAKAFGQLTNNTEVHGASPYGSGTVTAGDGSRLPSDLEKEICRIQGESFAEVVSKQFA